MPRDIQTNETVIALNKILRQYKTEIESADNAEREAKSLWKQAEKDFFVDVVKAAARYSVQKDTHRKYVIEQDNGDEKRMVCIEKTKARVPDFDTIYMDKEQECIQFGNVMMSKEKKKIRNAVKTVEGWLKGLKYAAGICVVDYSENLKESKSCLRRFVKSDNYDKVIYRHIRTLDIVQQKFLEKLTVINENLDQCLNNVFSRYLEDLRNFRRNVDNCYGTSETVDTYISEFEPQKLVRRKGTLKCAP